MKKRILPKLAPLPIPQIGKPNMDPLELACFWCEDKLEVTTRDHVIPRWLGGGKTKQCCITCNNERSKISTIACSLKNGNSADFTKLFVKIIPIIEKYEKLIKSKLDGDEAKICLEEIYIVTNHFKGVYNEQSSLSTCRNEENPCQEE